MFKDSEALWLTKEKTGDLQVSGLNSLGAINLTE